MKYICLFFFVFNIAFAEPAPQVFIDLQNNANQPVLLTDADFPKDKKHEKQNYYYGSALSKKILNNYVFLAEFEEFKKKQWPPGWISVQKEPLKALWAGEPFSFSQPEIKLELPLFRLPLFPYLKGTENIVTLINTVLDDWTEGRSQQAFDDFDAIFEEIKTSKLPKAKLEVSLANVIRGYFLLDMVTKNIELSGAKIEGNPKQVLKPEDLFVMARSAMRLGFEKMTVDKFISSLNNNVDEDIFGELLTCPFFHEDINKADSLDKKCIPKVMKRSLYPVVWLRSIAPSLLWNLAVMQRMNSLWDDAFTASEALETFFAKMDANFLAKMVWPASDVSPLLKPKLSNINVPIRLWPHKHKDLLAASQLLRAQAMFMERDPLEILRYSDAAIRQADSLDLSALGFWFVGATYFSLGNYPWARKAFSWCEGVSETASSKYPFCVFFGAEAAFWEGKFTIAEKGFTKALNSTGDKEYSPWMRFRLGNILEQNNDAENAQLFYNEIVRLFALHPIYSDSLVRSYCYQLSKAELAKEVRRKYLQKINDSISQARVELKLQAKTCILMSNLQNKFEEDGNSVSSVALDAKSQLQLLQEYQTDFPKSKYSMLFADRIAKLDLSFVQDLANKNECKELLAVYDTQKTFLNSLGSNGKQYLKSLSWEAPQRRIVMRCAALLEALPLWTELRKSDIAKDGGKLQEKLYDYYKLKKSVKAGKALLATVVDLFGFNTWSNLSYKLDIFGKKHVTNEFFWQEMAVDAVLRFDLKNGVKERNIIKNILFAELKKDPDAILTSEVACVWLLREQKGFTEKNWDNIAKSQTSEFWLDFLFDNEQNKDSLRRCQSQVSILILQKMLKNGSAFRDEFLVMPYLEKKGMITASDEWLLYLQNAEIREGRSKRISAFYVRMFKETKDERVRAMARAWLEKLTP